MGTWTALSRRLPLLWLLFILPGCASKSGGGLFDSVAPDAHSRDPIVRTMAEGQLRLKLRVVGHKELKEDLGVDLGVRRIRGLWIAIENRSDAPYWLLRSSLDWDYYPVSEILYSLRGELDQEQFKALKEKLLGKRFQNPVPAHSQVSGYLFISSNHLNRVAQLMLRGVDGAWKVPVYLQVPELQGYRLPQATELYSGESIVDTDVDGLRRLLEQLPCCTTDARGERQGDPLNLVLVGSASDVHYTLARRGWHSVEKNYLQSAEKTVNSFLFGDQYRYSPVSPLYAFGRKQDYAVQKARANITRRNHLRLWLTPWTVEGKPVWVGQVSRDIGVHMTSQSPIFFTHKIDPDVDEDRNYLIEDLILTEQVEWIGYVAGLGNSSAQHPQTNLTGDPYFTDGLRAVIFLGSHEDAVLFQPEHRLQFLDWDHTANTVESRHIDKGR